VFSEPENVSENENNMKTTIVSLLIISLLIPSFASAFSYEPDKPLAQYPEEGIFLGVAAGLARKTGIEPIYFRVGFVLSAFMGGTGLILYFVLAAIMPTRHLLESPIISVPPTSPPAKDEATPKIYFQQVNNLMKEMLVAGIDLMKVRSQGEITQVEYARKLRDVVIQGRDKFNNLTVPPECREVYQLFSEYFRYSILSADVLIEGLESGDEGKIREAEINAKTYDEKAAELYNQAKSKILNWGR